MPCRRFLHHMECVTVPLASQTEDAHAKQFDAPTDGAARIYLIRPGTMAPKQKTEIFFDGKLAGILAPMTYLMIDTHVGAHTVGFNLQPASWTSLNVKGDQNTYIQEQISQFFSAEKIAFVVLDTRSGQSDVLKSSLISMTTNVSADHPPINKVNVEKSDSP